MSELEQLNIIDPTFRASADHNIRPPKAEVDPCRIHLSESYPTMEKFLALSEEKLASFIMKELIDREKKYQITMQPCDLSISLLQYNSEELIYGLDFEKRKEEIENKISKSWNFLKEHGYISYIDPSSKRYIIKISEEGRKFAQDMDSN